jgi:hypothetical protein
MSRKALVPVNVPALASAPTLPTLVSGDLYFNTTNATLYSYNGSSWVASSGSSSAPTISDTAPVSPSSGSLWFNSSTGQLFIYYSGYWIEIGAGGGAGSAASVPYVYYLDGGSSGIIGDIVYDAGAASSAVNSWNYTIDAGTSVLSF